MIKPGTTWYWQIDGKVNTTRDASVYDIDAEEATSQLVAGLKRQGITMVGYFSAGTWEAYRSDAKQFPPSVIGHKLSGWSENYVDIRSPIVRQIMAARMDAAKAKGFDALEPDVMDAWQNNSGFPITQAEQTEYALWLAGQAHTRGMLIALKNVPELVPACVASFDFSIAEQAFSQNYTAALMPFIAAGKAVLAAEYAKSVRVTWCTKAKALQFSLAYYNLALNGKRYLVCP